MLAARFDATPDDEAALQQAVAGTPTSLAGAVDALLADVSLMCSLGCSLKGGRLVTGFLQGWEAYSHDAAAQPPRSVRHASRSAAELPALLDAELLGKYLKVPREELEVGSLADAQLMRMAARDC